MTQRYFDKQFKEAVPNWQVMTLTDRRLQYNELMEQYNRNGLITDIQRQSWGHPPFLTKFKNKINFRAY